MLLKVTLEEMETYSDYNMLMSTGPVRGGAEVLVMVFLILKPHFFLCFMLLHFFQKEEI